MEKGRRVLCIYKMVLTNHNKVVFILANQRSSVILLEYFPALITELTCPRYPALDKERFRCLHTGLFMIIIVIYVHYAIQRETI